MSNTKKKSGVVFVAGILVTTATGCVVYERPRPVAVVEQPAPVVEETVVTGSGVEVIEVEPAPEERVYVYDPGYPPGVYFYNGFYWYGGYRYEHDVFVNRYVVVNIREHRYVNVEENRRSGVQIEQEHRRAFAVNHGRPAAGRREAEVHAAPRAPQRGPAAQKESDKRLRPGSGQASARD
jgi:hypothetical protein